MTEPKVYNRYHRDAPPGTVYIGRGGYWGNPFVIGKDGDRDEVIAKHRAWLLGDAERARTTRAALAGKSVVCFCAPKPCHGDTLVEISNCDDETFEALLREGDPR